MTWVAWRQQRLQIIITLAVVALAAAVFVWLRLDMDAFMRSRGGMAGCWGRGDGCTEEAMSAFSDRYNQFLSNYPLVLLCLPALLGIFAGAPLFAGEFEQGTHVFGLTQSVSRTRWWFTKIGVAGLPVVLAMLALGLVIAWALQPADLSGVGRMQAPYFETRGLALGAYTLLAFAVGVAAGLLLKNAVGAMAVTMVLYIGLLIVVANGVRPFYAEPQRATLPVGSASGLIPDNAWRVGETSYLDSGGQPLPFTPKTCMAVVIDSVGVEPRNTVDDCLRQAGAVSISATYHPDSGFWRFQAVELGVMVLLGGLLLALGGWTLRRALR